MVSSLLTVDERKTLKIDTIPNINVNSSMIPYLSEHLSKLRK